MAVAHYIDSANHLVITTCGGLVTFEDAVVSLSELRHDPRFRPEFWHVADLSHASRLVADFHSLRDLHMVHDPFSRQGKRALVIAAEGDSAVLARMYQTIVNSPRLAVFQSFLDAITWLEVPATILEHVVASDFCSLKADPSDDATLLELPAQVPTSFHRRPSAIHRGGAATSGGKN